MTTYTIKLRDGKYTVMNTDRGLECLRYGEAWPAAEDFRFNNVMIAMAERIQELEEAVKAVLDGTPDERGGRRADGLLEAAAHREIDGGRMAAWEFTLRDVLEQES